MSTSARVSKTTGAPPSAGAYLTEKPFASLPRLSALAATISGTLAEAGGAG